jgi:hypothetical protein
MDENSQIINDNTKKNKDKLLSGIIIALVICMVLAVLGTCFGIYGTIQANNALTKLDDDYPGEDMEFDGGEIADENKYSKPSTVDEIELVAISYNDNKDFVDIVKNQEESYIDYYTSDENGDYVGTPIETDVTELLQYVFDNDLEYLGDNDILDNETWSLEIDTSEGVSYISGESNPPKWFNELLKKLDVDNKGYKSRQ